MTENDDENGTTNVRGKPNAYWERMRQEREEQIEAHERGDTFSGDFRGTKPRPHGGTATVRPDQIIGADDLCWCGLPAGHDWPGKRVGAKHPKGEDKSMARDTGTMPDLDRRELRAYHRRLQDFIISCVKEGLRYRLTKNSVILYPPDGSTPMAVHARNTDNQLRPLQRWYVEHVYQPDPVDEDAIRKLAETKNDPVEHPVKEPERPAEIDAITVNAPAQPIEEMTDLMPTEEEPVLVVTPGAWVHWRRGDGSADDMIETDGVEFRCNQCVGTDHYMLGSNPRSIGGHKRMYHTDTSTLHGPEARQKGLDTKRQRLIAESKVNQAIQLLIEFADFPMPESDGERVKELEAQVADLTEQVATLRKDAEEREAKLALIRETMGL